MSWRLLFATLLLALGASAWGGIQLGDWLVAHAPPAAPALPVMPFGWLLVSHDVFPNASGWSGTDNETLFHCGESGEMLGSAHPSSLAVAGAYLQKSFDLGAQPRYLVALRFRLASAEEHAHFETRLYKQLPGTCVLI